jgi:NADPH2 dehydrogenase
LPATSRPRTSSHPAKADLICLARAAIWDPRWAWHAAEELGAEAPYAPKTMAGHPKLRPQLFPKRAQAAG